MTTVGQHADPATCDHPVAARVDATWITVADGGRIRSPRNWRAICHDCGCVELDNGRWIL